MLGDRDVSDTRHEASESLKASAFGLVVLGRVTEASGVPSVVRFEVSQTQAGSLH